MSVPATNPQRIARMHDLLSTAFVPDTLEVIDDSHKHVGHAGARDGRGHFSIRVVSDRFQGLAPLARHRAVYAALGAMMEHDIHALSIQARTPDEWHMEIGPSG